MEAIEILLSHESIDLTLIYHDMRGDVTVFERAARRNQGRALELLLICGKAHMSYAAFNGLIKSAVKKGAIESLETLEKLCPGMPKRVLIEILRSAQPPEIWSLTHDCLRFFWEQMNNEERGLFVLVNLLDGNLFMVKWAVRKEGNGFLNVEVRGRGYPLFCAIEAGVRPVRILKEVRKAVDWQKKRRVGKKLQSALEFAMQIGQAEIVDLLTPLCQERPQLHMSGYEYD
jgi:hypothetical protein